MGRIQHQREFVRSLRNAPCTDCGQSFPWYVMQFDHVRGTKTANIAQIANLVSRERLLVEIAKCDLVCANCHAIRTHNRRADVAQLVVAAG